MDFGDVGRIACWQILVRAHLENVDVAVRVESPATVGLEQHGRLGEQVDVCIVRHQFHCDGHRCRVKEEAVVEQSNPPLHVSLRQVDVKPHGVSSSMAWDREGLEAPRLLELAEVLRAVRRWVGDLTRERGMLNVESLHKEVSLARSIARRAPVRHLVANEQRGNTVVTMHVKRLHDNMEWYEAPPRLTISSVLCASMQR